ncbi:hypothetical protein D4S03_01845 [bacterium]|nr:MAG: hypothetical protein D4S03_01845 [bacterium]
MCIDQRLKDLKINITQAPDLNDKEIQRFQMDEKGFYELIVNTYKLRNPYFDESDKDFTLYQDVKSISAVNNLRRGQKPLKLSDARHIFITSNSTLAFASRQYEYKDADQNNGDLGRTYFFIPTAMTDIFIGTLLWGQSSSIAINSINQKKLISNCFAAMQPTKQLLKKYIEAAEREYQKGTVTEDEYTLLKVSRMARNLLAEETLNDPDLFTERTIPEILNDIRDNIRVEEEAKFKKDREEFESRDKQRKETLDFVNQELSTTKGDKERLLNNVENVAEKISGGIARFMFIVLAFLAIIAVVFQFLPSIFGNNIIVRWVLGIAALAFTLASLFTGFNITGAKDSIKRKIKLFVVRLLTK